MADEDAAVPSIDQVDEVMFADPGFESTLPVVEISSRPIELWLKALDRSDTDLLRVTIDTISIAHQRGMAGLDAAKQPLVELLRQTDLDAEVRRAAVKAIIELGAKDQAELLAEVSIQHGVSIALLVEPALAQWKSTAMAERWLQRLSDPGIGRQSLIHAIEGLGAIDQKDASSRLLQFVNDRSLPNGVRMAAARAAGQIDQPGLNEVAAKLVDQANADVVSGLLAVALLSRRTDEASVGLLTGLMKRENTAVQSESLRRLYEIDPVLVLEFVDQVITSNDVNVRTTIAAALINSRDQTKIAPLATLLDDVNPTLRQHVAASLVELAQDPELRDEVISQASGILDQDQWRGCEQAALVLVNLDHKPAGDRLVDLMSHSRGEVMVTAGWGLRRLALKKHLPAMLGRAQSIYDGFQSRKLSAGTPGAVGLMSQLFMAFGQMRYREADGLARKYVPRDFSLGINSRAAAAWTIGLLYEGKAPDDLVKMLLARLNDVDSMVPEFDSVRQMCAVSLARMNAVQAVPDLRKYATKNPSTISLICHWALEKLTGQKPPTFPTPNPLDYHDWFLAPLPNETTTTSP